MEVELIRGHSWIELRFIGLDDKPIVQKLSKEFIQDRLKEPVFRTKNLKISHLFPEVRDYLLPYASRHGRVDELENWFNQPLEFFLKRLEAKGKWLM